MSAEDPRILALRKRRELALEGGGRERVERHHAKGRRTARERLAQLFDSSTFQELGLLASTRLDREGPPGDGVVVGFGQVDGRTVFAYAQDATVFGGALGEMHGRKICQVMDLAVDAGAPIVGLIDSGGARIQEGIYGLGGYADIFRRNATYSGIVPQLSLLLGPCAGGAAYSPALTDFIIQTRQAQMFITGPQVIKQVTGEQISADQLGGADSHMRNSGVIHFIAENDEDALYTCRRLLSFLPSNNLEEPPLLPTDETVEPLAELNTIVPLDTKQAYDVRDVITRVVDQADFLEVQAGYAANMVIGFGRILGRTVGIVANQPKVLSGAIDINAATKTARFIRFCNAFNIPLVTFVDTPGFLPGVDQESGGIIRHGAKILFAYSAASVPKIQLILRKSYGGAHVAMSSRDLGADAAFAWPTAEIAVMGAEGAVEIVFRKEMDEATDKAARRAELIEQYRATFASPYVAAGRRLIDDIIEPAHTRRILAQTLEYLKTKRDHRPPKKHGLIPL